MEICADDNRAKGGGCIYHGQTLGSRESVTKKKATKTGRQVNCAYDAVVEWSCAPCTLANVEPENILQELKLDVIH